MQKLWIIKHKFYKIFSLSKPLNKDRIVGYVEINASDLETEKGVIDILTDTTI